MRFGLELAVRNLGRSCGRDRRRSRYLPAAALVLGRLRIDDIGLLFHVSRELRGGQSLVLGVDGLADRILFVTDEYAPQLALALSGIRFDDRGPELRIRKVLSHRAWWRE